MVLQRSKLSVRRTVMMLTIRSRNRDNGARRREGGLYTRRCSLGARFHEKSLYGRWVLPVLVRRGKRFFFSFFFFFLAVGENIAKENGSRRGRFLSPYGYTHLKDA